MSKKTLVPENSSFVLPPLTGWRRAMRFVGRPLSHQYYSLALRAQRVFPQFRFSIQLPCGPRYRISNSEVDQRILFEEFELAETQFLQRYLKPGMRILDIGAHHGFYSLVASVAVGPQGSVDAFEPSPREFLELQHNVQRNRCRNIRAHRIAVSSSSGVATLFQATKRLDGFNSLRRQANVAQVTAVEVPTVTLTEFLHKSKINTVDLIKIDTEGAELSVLQGAQDLLTITPRPLILAEVSDLRTNAWGYFAREIVHYLQERNFEWYGISEDGSLINADVRLDFYNDNLLAVPIEKVDQLRSLAGGTFIRPTEGPSTPC